MRSYHYRGYRHKPYNWLDYKEKGERRKALIEYFGDERMEYITSKFGKRLSNEEDL